jgi:quinoprotein glucose dehydrogenase
MLRTKPPDKWKKIYSGLFACVVLLVIAFFFYSNYNNTLSGSVEDWSEYNGGPDRNHYSFLTEIDATNVQHLEKVWEYSSGGADTVRNHTQMQCNPIIIDGVLYGVSAGSQAFALDASNGKEIWKTDFTDETYAMTSRGVTYHAGKEKQMIFFGFGHLLYCLDAKTGVPIPSFGDNGKINLRDGLSQPGADDYVVYNTPGVIFESLLITGVRVSEGLSALPGDIRAFDVNTGKLVWTFHTIPATGEWGSDTWPANARQHNGGANSWMGMAIDRENETVYVPTGSASFDFYGGDRHGSNLFANCLLALDARTGKRKWHYQVVHHDIWDRDLPAPPNLLTITKNNKQIEAVAQITKQGHVFVFNRHTGQPLFPIEERPVLSSDIPGEQAYPTQPIPKKPAPFTRQAFTEKDINKNVADSVGIKSILRKSRTGNPYIPVTAERTIIFPGTDGGAQWGGAAVDRDGIMYIPAKEIPVFTSLADAPATEGVTSSQKLYQAHCASCHGSDLRGDHSGTYPSLVDVSRKTSHDQLSILLKRGRGMMPAFNHLSEKEREAIVSFVMERKDITSVNSSVVAKRKSAYVHTGYNRWYDTSGFPVNTPPWGTLTAINLQTGEHLWQVPLGEFPALSKKGIPLTGTDNYGGPLVTASGLIFIAATPDKKFRAIDKNTGRLLWENTLPAAGFASPSTYAVNGKQYIVIACGGGKLRSISGDKYVAFALK